MLSYDPHSRGQGHVGSAGRAGTEELVPAGLLGDRGWCSEPSEGSTTRHPNSLQPFTPRIQLHTARPRALSNLQYPPTAASDREETPRQAEPGHARWALDAVHSGLRGSVRSAQAYALVSNPARLRSPSLSPRPSLQVKGRGAGHSDACGSAVRTSRGAGQRSHGSRRRDGRARCGRR